MRRWTPAWLILIAALSLGASTRKLDAEEVDHYNALRVWMLPKQQKLYLKGKTRDERDAFLKELGFWDRFYRYDEETRSRIVSGDIAVGDDQDMVFMAWGPPTQSKRLTGRFASRSELLVYRFEITNKGEIMVWAPKSKATYKAVDKYQLELYVDDSLVVEIQSKDDWE